MKLTAGSQGFDISHHQSINYDGMMKAKAAGYSFVFIRASHGFNKDKKFEKHYSAAKAAGLQVGTYSYYYYKDDADSKRETETFLKAIDGKHFDFPVCVDAENRGEYARGRHLGALPYTTITDRVLAALSAIKAAGFRTGLYCDVNWAKTKMQMERIPSDCTVWLADWAGKLDYSDRCEIRQYSDNIAIPGVGSGIDANRLLVDFATEVIGGAFGVIVNCMFWCNRRMGPSTDTQKMGKATRGLDIFINGKRYVKGVLWYHDSDGTWLHSKFVQTNPDEIPYM